MATLINNAGVQHYANKMVLAENRKVGSKSLPTALTDIDNLIDEMKTHFDAEYGSALDMKLENNENIFSVGTGTNVDKRSEVENSFTDVELSGNSLVNLCPQKYKFVTVTTKGEATIDGLDVTYDSPTYRIKAFTLTQSLKPNTTYTAIVNVLSLINTNTIDSYVKYSDGETLYGQFSATQLGLNIKKFTTTNKIATELAYYLNSGERSAKISGVIILEGDWTNKPIPQHFEGLKSIGEKEDGSHKISILSRGKNLCDINNFQSFVHKYIEGTLIDNKIIINNKDVASNERYSDGNLFKVKVKPNTTYTLSYKTDGVSGGTNGTDTVEAFITTPNIAGGYLAFNIPPSGKSFNTGIHNVIGIRLDVNMGGKTHSFWDFQLEEGSTATEYEPYKEDKKEISLNEPLRGLPNGIRDTIEKVNGEWKIVRRCGEVILDNSLTYNNHRNDDENFDEYKISDFPINTIRQSTSISDKFPQTNYDRAVCTSGVVYIRFSKAREINTLEKCQQWFANNPTKIVYALETPIIEDISPVTLQCWKNGTISIDEVLPVETTHTVALNKPAQIKRNIEELTALRKRVQALEDFYDQIALEQAHQLSLINHSIELDYDI